MLVSTKNTWDLAQTPQTFNVFLLFLCMYRKYLIWQVMIVMYIGLSVIDQSLDLDWKIWLFVAFQGLGLKMKGVGPTLRNVVLKHPFLLKIILHFNWKTSKGEFFKDFFVVYLNNNYPFLTSNHPIISKSSANKIVYICLRMIGELFKIV